MSKASKSSVAARNLALAAVLLAPLSLLGACGQKGPLVLPPPSSASGAASAPAPTAR